MAKESIENIVDKLQKAAYQSAFSGNGKLPKFAIRYRQGKRTFYTTAMTAEEIIKITEIDSTDRKEDHDPQERWNRPYNHDHADAIVKYLTSPETKTDYILPPITLDAEIQLDFVDCTGGDENQMAVGLLLIPINYRFHVTDGQHRIKAISMAITENEALRKDGFPVKIVQEEVMDKVHQDFADCAKVRPIAASLITTFETRDAIRVFTKEVCERVSLFDKRVEKVSNSVGKTSSKLYTINHVKLACEELLIGDSTGQDRKKSKLCAEELANGKFEKWLERVVKFFNLFAQANPQWKEVLNLDSSSKYGNSTLKKMKEEFLIFNGTTLAIIGKAGHEILKDPQLLEENVRALANLDWHRKVENKDGLGLVVNPLWFGNILIADGKVANTRDALVIAGAKLKERLRLPLTPKEKAKLNELQVGEAHQRVT